MKNKTTVTPVSQPPIQLNDCPETTVVYKERVIVKALNFFGEIEFFIKVAVVCTLLPKLTFTKAGEKDDRFNRLIIEKAIALGIWERRSHFYGKLGSAMVGSRL